MARAGTEPEVPELVLATAGLNRVYDVLSQPHTEMSVGNHHLIK